MAVHQEFAGQAALYVLGTLTGADESAFEAHLSVCAACTAEVREFVPVIEALATATPEATPGPRVRHALLTRMRSQRGFQATALALVASVILILGLGAYALQLRSRVGELDATTAVLAAPDLAHVDLAGQSVAPSATARIFYSRSKGLLFTASSLPAAPTGRTYQLWVLTGDPAPTSAGLLKPDADGRVTALFPTPPDLPKPVAMAVTLEPEGGVLSPTGDKYLVGLAN